MYKKLKAVLFIVLSTQNVPWSGSIVKDMCVSSSVHVLKYSVKSMIFRRPSSSDFRGKNVGLFGYYFIVNTLPFAVQKETWISQVCVCVKVG